MAEETNPTNPDETKTQGEAGEKQPAADEAAPKTEAAAKTEGAPVERKRRRQSQRKNSRHLQPERLKTFLSQPKR